MKANLTKLMSVALLFAASLMATGCSKDDDGESLSTRTADELIEVFTELDVLNDDGSLVDDTEPFYLLVAEDEGEADVVEFLELIVGGTFDTSGDKITLADGSSYVNIVKSSVEGEFYTVTFSLKEIDAFEVIIVEEAYFNGDNELTEEQKKRNALIELALRVIRERA